MYYSNGKLLLTGEYLVLDGAKSLAIPTKYGQNLTLSKRSDSKLLWESIDENDLCWFRCEFELPNLEVNIKNNLSLTLQKILKQAKKLNQNFLTEKRGFNLKTKLSFSRNWGLGTSSTLINNIANWANIDAFELLKNSFGGSGYDIACAQNKQPILYQRIDSNPKIDIVNFSPKFIDQLYFIHLNKKQDSKEGIKKYKEFKGDISPLIIEISQLTCDLIGSSNLIDFENILIEHERIIASLIAQKPIQKTLFSDYFGQTKSLGAWGGDFIIATGNNDTPTYFKNKGFETVIAYRDLIL